MIELAREKAEKGDSVETKKGKWIYIKSKDEDPKNFNSNVELLRAMSCGTEWCTARGAEVSKLEQGGFWVYRVGDRSKLIIHVEPKRNRILEIRGDLPRQSVDPNYVSDLIEFNNKMKFNEGKEFINEVLLKQELVNLALSDEEDVTDKVIEVALKYGYNFSGIEKTLIVKGNKEIMSGKNDLKLLSKVDYGETNILRQIKQKGKMLIEKINDDKFFNVIVEK
jgi:hypothetical protein